MRCLLISSLGLWLLACGGGSTQTGSIASCSGISLSGPGAFLPLSGMAYQNAKNLGGGESAPGTYEVVLWATQPDAADATDSYGFVCRALTGGSFVSSTLYVPPKTLDIHLTAPLTSSSYRTSVTELTSEPSQPYGQTSPALEDVSGSVVINGVGTLCLTGSFSASLVPVDPATGFAIDGGAASVIEGTFSVPFCG